MQQDKPDRGDGAAALTFPVRMEWIFLEVVSHMPAPDWPSLATHVCCRMFAQACMHRLGASAEHNYPLAMSIIGKVSFAKKVMKALQCGSSMVSADSQGPAVRFQTEACMQVASIK